MESDDEEDSTTLKKNISYGIESYSQDSFSSIAKKSSKGIENANPESTTTDS